MLVFPGSGAVIVESEPALPSATVVESVFSGVADVEVLDDVAEAVTCERKDRERLRSHSKAGWNR